MDIQLEDDDSSDEEYQPDDEEEDETAEEVSGSLVSVSCESGRIGLCEASLVSSPVP